MIAVDHLPTKDAEGAALAHASTQTASIVLIPSLQQLPQAMHDAVAPDLHMDSASPEAAGRLSFKRRTLRDYSKLVATYGDRFQMQDRGQVQPLPSGLLGDILLTQ